VVVENGGECWLEFRTCKDGGAKHVFGEHFRHYLEPQQVTDELEIRGLRVLELVEGRGLAPHGEEDPLVARIRVGGASC